MRLCPPCSLRSLALAALALAAPARAQFTDVSTAAGLDLTDMYWSATGHGIGLVWIDANNDLYPDIFVTNGFGMDEHFYLNNGDGTFTKRDDLLPPLPDVDMMGAIFADYDNDGDQDIYVFTENEDFELWLSNDPTGPANLLLQNQFVESGNQIPNGAPLFLEVAQAAGVTTLGNPETGAYQGYRSSTGGWLDFDRDGWVDLYVVNWVLQENTNVGNLDILYRNNGDGTFTDVTVQAGLPDGTDPNQIRAGLGWVSADLNGDDWPDMIVVNVHNPDPHHYDQIWLNNQDGTFMDATSLSPGFGDDSGAGMGADVGDFDLDGDFDLWISDMYVNPVDQSDGNPFYINHGDGTFTDNVASLVGAEGNNSWAVIFADFDRDGYEDMFMNGMGGIPPYLYWNQQDRTFLQVGWQAGFRNADEKGRGAAVADYDLDGDLDVALVSHNASMRLFRNDTDVPYHWLKVRLEGTVSNRSAIGAIVKVRVGPQMTELVRTVKGGSGAHSQNELTVHFGLNLAPVVRELEVRWPSGQVDLLTDVAVDQELILIE